ncbi:MAG TPA: fibronectin type III domain-containing protein [Anaerolineae bacterium]|nr:fibronectin type III domain-containing protein [Anaerolineae bacterium]
MKTKPIIRILFTWLLIGAGSILFLQTMTSNATAQSPAAPIISDLQTEAITPFSARITWKTDIPANSQVKFWSGDEEQTQQVSQSTLTVTHEILLTGLAGDTDYHYHAMSRSGDSEIAVALLQSFTTSSSPIMFSEEGGFLVDGEPFFPIMQWLQCGHRIEYQSMLGINTFMGMGCSGDTSQSYLDTCQANGVRGIIKFDASVEAHPSLLGWYWEDEPEMPRSGDEPSLYPDELRAVYEMVRAEDQAHPFLTTFTSRFAERFGGYAWMGEEAEEYLDYVNATDVPGFDHYPVYGWCRPDWLHEISDFQEEFMDYTAWRPTYQWIEAAKTTSKYCELSGRGENDGPYPSEIRNEVWQAIVHGAKAIGYFTHSWECPGYTQFCLSTEQEVELTRINQQITALAPAILGPDRSQRVSAQESGGGRVDVTAREYNGDLYIFVVNLERASEAVIFTVDGISSATVEVIDESRNITLNDGQFEDTFEELAVHLYRIPNAQAADLTLHGTPANSAIHLTWEVNVTLPTTSTWTINYETSSSVYLPITGLTNTLRARTLTGLTNYAWYTVTLHAMLDDTSWLSDTVRVMPTDRCVYLPLVLR